MIVSNEGGWTIEGKLAVLHDTFVTISTEDRGDFYFVGSDVLEVVRLPDCRTGSHSEPGSVLELPSAKGLQLAWLF